MSTFIRKESSYCFFAAALVLLIGFMSAAGFFYLSKIRRMPSVLADVFREPQTRLTVPGSVDLHLNRVGTYGIYFEYGLVRATAETLQVPPALDCTLTSYTGQIIQGVPDYVITNRYWSNDAGGPAILIQNITVAEPGEYAFDCHYQEDNPGPDVTVSLGPNYTWEFVRLVLKNGPVLIGMILSLTGSFLVSIIFILAGIFQIKNPDYSE